MIERERQSRVSDIYHAALGRTSEERTSFVAQACGGDDALRQDVMSLLRYESGAARFLEQPAVALGGGALEEQTC